MRLSSSRVLAMMLMLAPEVGASSPAEEAKRPEARPDRDRSSDLVCNVERGGTILSLLPGGMAVKKGDLVCELDASGLNDRLLEETIAVKRAEGEYKAARLAHEAAMMAVKEYPECDLPAGEGRDPVRDQAGGIRAGPGLGPCRRDPEDWNKGNVSQAQKVAAELSFQRHQVRPRAGPGEAEHFGEGHQAEHGQAARRRGREDPRPGARREGHPGAAAGPRAEDPPADRRLPDRGPVGRPGVPRDAACQAGRRDQRRAGRRGRERPRAAGPSPRRARRHSDWMARSIVSKSTACEPRGAVHAGQAFKESPE